MISDVRRIKRCSTAAESAYYSRDTFPLVLHCRCNSSLGQGYLLTSFIHFGRQFESGILIQGDSLDLPRGSCGRKQSARNPKYKTPRSRLCCSPTGFWRRITRVFQSRTRGVKPTEHTGEIESCTGQRPSQQRRVVLVLGSSLGRGALGDPQGCAPVNKLSKLV